MPPKRKAVSKPEPEPEVVSEPEPEVVSETDEENYEEEVLDEDGELQEETEIDPNEVIPEDDEEMEGDDEMDEPIAEADIEEDDEPMEEDAPACASTDMIDMREDDYIIEQSDYVTYNSIDISTPQDLERYHTNPYMTKYEMVRVLGIRSAQLERGAAPLVQPEDFDNGRYPVNNIDIAHKELKLGRCPFIIVRPFPNGIGLKIKVNLLKILNYH